MQTDILAYTVRCDFPQLGVTRRNIVLLKICIKSCTVKYESHQKHNKRGFILHKACLLKITGPAEYCSL